MKRYAYTPASPAEVRTLALLFFIAFVCLLMVTGCAKDDGTSLSSTGNGSNTVQPGRPGTGSGGGWPGGGYNGGGGGSDGGTGGNDGGATTGSCVNTVAGLSAQESQFIEEVCVLTNQEREKHGLPTLTLDAKMTEAAQAHAIDMYTRNYFSHDNPEGESPFDRMRSLGIKFGYAAENIARGYPTPASVVEGWMNSSGHRANILHNKMKRLGVGYHQGYWVQNFAD